jgi:hypothetical protein
MAGWCQRFIRNCRPTRNCAKLLRIDGVTREDGELTRLTTAELVAQLAQQAKALGIELDLSYQLRSRSRREWQIGISGADDLEEMQIASALVFVSLLLAARTIIFRLITKVFVRFASVALIAAMVQASLISPPSAQTTSAEHAREVLGSSPSETVEQIEGTYEGTFTINQVTGEHQISLTFQQSGSEITVTCRKSTPLGSIYSCTSKASTPRHRAERRCFRCSACSLSSSVRSYKNGCVPDCAGPSVKAKSLAGLASRLTWKRASWRL